MAKKFVRGVTGVDDIDKFDKSLTNVNDIISDGQDTYVHTKKGKNEFYYKVTDGVKQVESTDNTLTITKDNDTVSIANNGLATKEELASKQDALSVGDGLSLENNKIEINPTSKDKVGMVNGIYNSTIDGNYLTSLVLSLKNNNNTYLQLALRESGSTPGRLYVRNRFLYNNGVTSDWRELMVDGDQINNLLNQKQNTITNNTSIGVSGTGLRQLYTQKQTYTVTGGVLKTHVKSVSPNTSVTTAQEEFNFIVKLNKAVSSVNFTLNEHDKTKFTNIMTTYGDNNTVRISGCVFTLSGSTLTVSTANNTQQNYVITFSDII